MLLKHLSLTHYRVFKRLDIEFAPGATLIIGANAQGKTSLLEAIFYLTGANGVQATHDRELINFRSREERTPYARLLGEVEAQARKQTIEIRLSLSMVGSEAKRRLKKEILVNGVNRRVSDLPGVFNAVLFLPQDINVVEGSPGSRRAFLDSSLSQADPSYAAALSEYRKVISQRNALLKQLRERRGRPEQLTFWDQKLCDHGSLLIVQRARALAELGEIACQVHEELTRGSETLLLRYLPKYEPDRASEGPPGLNFKQTTQYALPSREDVQSGLTARLIQIRGQEIRRGVSVLGPHRDDFQFRVNDVDIGSYGSRGQNRTAMLALKLAEIRWLKRHTGEWPVLLLDEVLAELDVERRSALLRHVSEAPQVLLTAADPEMFTQVFRRSATIWKVEAGALAPYRL